MVLARLDTYSPHVAIVVYHVAAVGLVEHRHCFVTYIHRNLIHSSFVTLLVYAWWTTGKFYIGKSGGYNRSESKIYALCLVAFLTLSITQMFLPNIIDWNSLSIPATILGILSAWGLYDAVVSSDFTLSQHRLLNTTCQFTFFIYLFHEPTLNIVKKLVVVAFGKNNFGYLLSYLMSPWIFVLCAVVVGMAVKKFAPKVYFVCTGGR